MQRSRICSLIACFVIVSGLGAEEVQLPGLRQPVEILRDRWGVPHIYAKTADDLFFAQGYIAARDRLFQIDLWRRIGTGKLAEAIGPSAVARDRLARLIRYRGDWEAEWTSYAPDTRQIATAFTNGINAYIRSLNGKRPPEFEAAGYDPGLWVPEDCVARMAGLLMTRNLTREVARAQAARTHGLERLQVLQPPDPPIRLEIPNGLDLDDISDEIVRVYNEAIGAVRFGGEQGSNNWAVTGRLTTSGKPLLASDPHRPVQIPSLRKTVHLVGPGWNVIGAGEPALPGIALGHNEEVGFGFTIVGIDQVDLYVEKLNPKNPDEYLYRGAWRRMEVEREEIRVRGRERPETVELRYTHHGPVIHEDRARNRAYALKWVGSEPGTAGYLAALSVSRAKNWKDFVKAMERYKVPSENMMYADRAGNIGWIAAGLAPIRKNWSGLFPVPGDTGEYEWSGWLPLSEQPQSFNPSKGWLATANHKVIPEGYRPQLAYEWAAPFRYLRIEEMIGAQKKFSIQDFIRMQQDVVSVPARRLQAAARKSLSTEEAASHPLLQRLLAWDAALTVDSVEASLYSVWTTKLQDHFAERGFRPGLDVILVLLEASSHKDALLPTFQATLEDLRQRLGEDSSKWNWGRIHTLHLRHPIDRSEWHRGPVARPGDGNTVNSTSGANYRQTNGASYRQILDLSDWDRSVMTNVPGESGDPASPHYSDLMETWARGEYHPMPYSRKAVEAATVERIDLKPAR